MEATANVVVDGARGRPASAKEVHKGGLGKQARQEGAGGGASVSCKARQHDDAKKGRKAMQGHDECPAARLKIVKTREISFHPARERRFAGWVGAKKAPVGR